MANRLASFALIARHDVVRYREPARDLDAVVERLADAEVVVAIRERAKFTCELLVFSQQGSRDRSAVAGYQAATDKAELFANADVLSLHVRVTPARRAASSGRRIWP